MAGKAQLKILARGIRAWNRWRKEYPKVSPDLTQAKLRGADLREADLHDANLSGADLSGANLRGAILRRATLTGTNLTDADLTGADFFGAVTEFNIMFESGLSIEQIKP